MCMYVRGEMNGRKIEMTTNAVLCFSRPLYPSWFHSQRKPPILRLLQTTHSTPDDGQPR